MPIKLESIAETFNLAIAAGGAINSIEYVNICLHTVRILRAEFYTLAAIYALVRIISELGI